MQLKYINTRVFIYFILLSLFFFSSCKKYLDEKPDSSLTVPRTLKELQGLFNDAELMNFGLTPSYGESSSDDYFLLATTYNTLPTQLQQIYNWTLKEYKFQNDWSKNYIPVYNSNFALEMLEKIPRNSMNDIEWQNVKGTALFFRAYSFLNLVWVYSKAYDQNNADTDLGIVLRLNADFNKPSHRSTVQETYSQILFDANESIQYLPDRSDNALLPSKAASYGLLARTYLSMGQYDSALKYSSLCLNLKNDLLDYNSLTLDDYNPFPRLDNPETIFYTEMNTFITNHYSFTGFVDSTLFSSYVSDDLRRRGYFRLENQYYRFKGAYTANSILLFTGLATDEMYLIEAECYARENMISESMVALNTLMEKRWNNSIPYPTITAIDQEDAINKVLNERRKELLMRGIRWSDIKRLNKEDKNIVPMRLINGETFVLLPNDSRYALPIPTDIISITGITQN